ncbi:MAG: T9SS type A sorting domain-containing protein [Bacteroidota bacterium]|nr:T9SS type A sorting domain-containing protein [Bacteroidota bacterium]
MKNIYAHYYLLVLLLFTASTLSALENIDFNNTEILSPTSFSEVIITSDYNGQALSCFQSADASAIVNTYGGQPPYNYEWSTGATTMEVIGLSAGIHFVTVTDLQSLSDVHEIFIEPPPPIDITIAQIGTDSLVADVFGGTPPYFVIWSTGDTTLQIGGLQPGIYEITVSDVNGCTETALYEIITPGPGWLIYPTNQFHTIIIPEFADLTVNGDSIEPGDQIGVFYDSSGTYICGGLIVWQGLADTLIAYGDDLYTTSTIDGFVQGEEFFWMIWDASRNEIFKANAEYEISAFPNSSNYSESGNSGILILQGYAEHLLELDEGWGYLSTYIDPFEASASDVFAALSQDIIIIKDENGLVYWPSVNINLIGSLVIGKGYQVKMDTTGGQKSSFELYINGVRVEPDEPIELRSGWNMISFLHTDPYPIITMLASIVQDIIIVKDEDGQVYIPNPPYCTSCPVNTIQQMKPGKGYKIKILAGNNIILEYPPPPEKKSLGNYEIYEGAVHYTGTTNTGNNHTIIIPSNAIPVKIEKGDEIAVFHNNKIIGAASLHNDIFAIPAFGNDETTKEKDGPVKGDVLNFKFWDKSENTETSFIVDYWKQGDEVYENDKLSIADEITINTENILINMSIYPNPNNGKFNLIFDGINGISQIEISDALGQILFESSEKIFPNQRINLEGYSPGVYYIKLKHKDQVILKEVVVH